MDARAATVGALLKRARQAAGWSQRELAARAGVHQPQIARIERGEDVQVSLLERVARPLGLEPALAVPRRDEQRPAATPASDSVTPHLASWSATWPQVDPEVFAVLTRLSRTGAHVEAAIERTASLHGMSAREVIVLGSLRRQGPPYESTPTGLKERLWLSLPGLKKRLDRLEALGMVTRVSNPVDRRGFMVRLTPRGHAALDDLVTHPQAVVYQALLEMEPADRQQLSLLLRGLLGRLEAEAGPAPPLGSRRAARSGARG
jgi:DNA-binding MarR family transcriptional regulator/transcriptional regulator with XRE-family HTH domain